tara:strand:+ start:1512 stop:1778 length:267 start_codon:yes stop_codon:yes gene_type:complete
MAIPKKYKKDLKKAFTNSRSTSAHPSSRPTRKKQWMFEVGDLVRESDSDIWGLVVSKPSSSGLMTVMTSSGKKTVYAGKLKRIQSKKW